MEKKNGGIWNFCLPWGLPGRLCQKLEGVKSRIIPNLETSVSMGRARLELFLRFRFLCGGLFFVCGGGCLVWRNIQICGPHLQNEVVQSSHGYITSMRTRLQIEFEPQYNSHRLSPGSSYFLRLIYNANSIRVAIQKMVCRHFPSTTDEQNSYRGQTRFNSLGRLEQKVSLV